MTIEIPNELLSDDAFNKLKTMKNKTLEPFNIGVKLGELTQLANSLSKEERADRMGDEAEALNANTPSWFQAWTDDRGNICHRFIHDKMGDELIKKFHLVRYPKLAEGAVYEPKRGAWRYFGKNEMNSLSDKQALTELQSWGYYGEPKFIPQVSQYVKRKTYDSTYSNATPFENSRPELVPFKNGTYDILNDEMKPHAPGNYILISYGYELDMTDKKTPASDKFFNDFFGENALFMMQFLGYTFYRSHAPAQELVFLHGEGGEGKSSFLNLISRLYITEENRSALTPQELAGDKFSVVELLGKAVNISGDLDNDYISQTGLLKRITGGDPLKGEYKGIQSFVFTSHAKHIFSLNEFFPFKDLSQGFSDRLAVVPITIGNQREEGATFWKQQDMKAIEEEAPAFVYKCIKEFRKIFDGKRAMFTKGDSMEQEKNAWIFDNDKIGQFILEGVEIIPGEERGERATEVYSEFKAFCNSNGFIPKSSQELTKYLNKNGVPRIKNRKGFEDGNSSQWRYKGLRMRISFFDYSKKKE